MKKESQSSIKGGRGRGKWTGEEKRGRDLKNGRRAGKQKSEKSDDDDQKKKARMYFVKSQKKKGDKRRGRRKKKEGRRKGRMVTQHIKKEERWRDWKQGRKIEE